MPAANEGIAGTMGLAFILDPAAVGIVDPGDVPNPDWLRPGIPGAGQQAFGDALLAGHPFVAVPTYGWSLIFDPARASGRYRLRAQHRFALDTRLHPAPP
ncbi:hypothetical protein [Roseicella aquatilis]|uniref:Uncharacterized protein n=1 Tax=Roseicella aquatilis TaxID=2527868 RepID=A0A4R4DRC0_9PROT|nr:hypothetical protein [Roseicella aquatilis]TCZ64809.1 hypothetical protein EXY23_05370 [Roseicella aquatilis]